ncbi:YMGG-like glycine zipper-containing protein [Desulfogranum marinum]|uniref:YMGG-like glycine zipper-containing protein n=1 Tax=Desulfogranum marinum TaxID=453220 RepID=UPI00196506AE|nr:hypothetical protein [Desulfogranum marinum]MBM9514884.1 hypothetical protein [Desulfogranum marinum]
MSQKLLRITIFSLLIFQLSGCAGIKNDGDRTRAEGAAVGAGSGAAIGGLVGLIIGSDGAGTLIGAGVGALTGLVGGYIYGDHVAKQKEKYAKEEDWLDACLKVAQKANSDIIICNKALKEEINYAKKNISNIKKTYSDKQKRKEKMLDTKKDIDNQLKSAQKALTFAKEELAAQTTVAADAKKNGQNDYAKDLDTEIKTLKANIKKLESHTDELASMSASMAV